MFYNNQQIHHPDSPREMNAYAWLANKHICARNEKIDVLQQDIDIDLSRIDSQVAEGIVYCKRTGRYFTIVYKQAPGMYVQQGFVSGSIEIPLPELYVFVKFTIVERDGKYRVDTDKMRITSPHRMLLPLSNIYNSNRDFEYNGYRDYGHNVCHGHVIDQLIGNQENINDIPTAFANAVKTFLLSHGNPDLDLIYDDNDELDNTALQLGRLFSLEEWGNERRTRCEQYEAYWCFLNYVSRTHTPEQIYETLQRCSNPRDVLDEFGVKASDLTDYQNSIRRDKVVVLYQV